MAQASRSGPLSAQPSFLKGLSFSVAQLYSLRFMALHGLSHAHNPALSPQQTCQCPGGAMRQIDTSLHLYQ